MKNKINLEYDSEMTPKLKLGKVNIPKDKDEFLEELTKDLITLTTAIGLMINIGVENGYVEKEKTFNVVVDSLKKLVNV